MRYFLKTGKLKITYLVYGVSLLVILMDCVFFNLIEVQAPVSILWGTYNKLLPGLLCFGLFLTVILCVRDKVSFNKSFIYSFSLLSAISVVCVVFLSGLRYPDIGLLSLLIETSHYWFLFLSVPLLYYLCNEEHGYEKIISLLNTIAMITYIIVIIQLVVYSRYGIYFLVKELLFRNQTVRLGLGCFGNAMILYNFDRFYNGSRKRTVYLLMAVVGMTAMLLVQQTRGYTIAVVIALGVIVLMNNRTTLKVLLNVLIIVGVFIYLIYSGIFADLLISLNPEQGENIGVRLIAVDYFWKEFIQNPLIGHGLAIGDQYRYIARSSTGLCFYSDVGVVGSLAQYGLFYLIIYIWPMIRMGQIAKELFANKQARQEHAFLIGLYCLLLLTSVSLVVTDMSRMLLFPFCIAIFEYQYANFRRQYEG